MTFVQKQLVFIIVEEAIILNFGNVFL